MDTFARVFAAITISKKQITSATLREMLSEIADVTDLSEVLIYRPKQGRLIEFITVLKEHQVAYEIAFEVS
jgi:hypothetical protein